MRIHTKQKCFYAILGLPSSGTSIVARFFHSLENAFCVAEPLHRQGLGSGKIIDFDKVGQLHLQGTPKEFLGMLHHKLTDSQYQMGGIKEVSLYEDERALRFEKCLLYDHFDCFIFIERDPKANYNSIRRRQKTFKDVDVVSFVESHIRFHRLKTAIKNSGKKVFTISYEDFCTVDSPVAYVNKVFDGFAKIEGKFHLPPVKKSFWFAIEQTAVREQGVKPPNMKCSLLRWQDVSLIEQYCYST